MKTITLTVALAVSAGIFCLAKNPLPLTNEICTDIANTTASTTVEDLKNVLRTLRTEDGLKKLSKLTNNRWSVDALIKMRTILLANGTIDLGSTSTPVVISEARVINAFTAIVRYYIYTNRLNAEDLQKSAQSITSKEVGFSTQEFVDFIDSQVEFVKSPDFLTGQPIVAANLN